MQSTCILGGGASEQIKQRYCKRIPSREELQFELISFPASPVSFTNSFMPSTSVSFIIALFFGHI
jgi:hypothetical protein